MDINKLIFYGGCALNLLTLQLDFNELCGRKFRRRTKRKYWMIKYHMDRTAESMEKLFISLMAEDQKEFKNFCRMSPVDFFYLMENIEPYIMKQDTTWRMAIPTKLRLAITLRYLASGDNFSSHHWMFHVSKSSICLIVDSVCKAICNFLKDEINLPNTPEKWLQVANGFNFPNCVGAIDGKHVVLQKPFKSGSKFFNYKKTFSIVLLAVVDSKYNFLYANIGAPGRISDGGVFQNSSFWQKLISDDLNLPPPCPLPGAVLTSNMPYVFLGDGAFALSTHVMKPYSGDHDVHTRERKFNYKLSSSRVIVENVFGVLTSVFQIFQRSIKHQPEKAALITLTCILLHNFLRRRVESNKTYTPNGTFDTIVDDVIVQPGSWRDQVSPDCALQNLPIIARRPSSSPLRIRNNFADYLFQQQ